MKYLIRRAAITLIAVCLFSYINAQPEVKPLKFSKELQQILDKKVIPKQCELLRKIIQSGAAYFRNITGAAFAGKPNKMDDHVAVPQQLFETNLEWPGSDDAAIQVDQTLYNNVPSYEKFDLRYTFYADSKPDSAKKLFRDIYESINGCIVLTAAGAATLVNEHFVPVSADGKGRYKGLIEFKQFFKETGISVKLYFTTDIGSFYNITLSFSKVRMHNKD